MTRAAHLVRGARAEQRALKWLRTHGLTLVTHNYRCRRGEIDLICRDKDTIVFVEVRYRRDTLFGAAAATVDTRKQHKLIRAAQYFLQTQPQLANAPMRFDVVGIEGSGAHAQIHWIKDAFQL